MAQSIAVPWKDTMRRVTRTTPGGNRVIEWMPAEHVVAQAREHFLEVVEWGEQLPLIAATLQRASAPQFLTGPVLRRLYDVLARRHADQCTWLVEVLRAQHEPDVRFFTPHGERCLVIDRQTHRRMAVYDMGRDRRVFTQDMGEGTIVYRMLFDMADRRWKVEGYVQELPTGWGDGAMGHLLQDNTQFLSQIEHMVTGGLMQPIGRDQ
jgi:hypothetical protein